MLTPAENSVIAEIKVASKFMEDGYEVFFPFGGKTSSDLVVSKRGILYRVQVKSTSQKSHNNKWDVELKRIRHNRTTVKTYLFDNTESDFLAIWIVPIDKVVILSSKTITTKHTLRVE